MCRQPAKKAPEKQPPLVSKPPDASPLYGRKQLHTHIQDKTEGQKRDDCSQHATGLVVLFRESGCTGPYFVTPSPSLPASTCLALGLSLCGTPLPPPLYTHTLTHTHAKSFIPLSGKEGCTLLLKQSHVATSACFRACEGDFHTAWCPQRPRHLPQGPDAPPAVVRG